MVPRLLDAADRRLGDVLEAATLHEHRRRLTRAGRLGCLDPPRDGALFAAGDPPPRAGNRLEVLVDGAAAFPAIVEAIEGAARSVHIASWALTPHFELAREEPPLILRELLAEAAERVDVRVLLWAGAPAGAFKPARSQVARDVEALVAGTRIRAATDRRERLLHCHHEKLVVVDGEVAFVGGIDMTVLGGDRYDTPAHPARGRIGWHDATSRLEGPATRDVGRHFAERWNEVDREPLQIPQTAALPRDDEHRGVDVQVVRTIPEGTYDFAPHGDFRILESYVRAIRSAERLVYVENQFLWAPEIVSALAEKLRRPPSHDFRVVVLLPIRANNGQEDTRGQLAVLMDADDGPKRFLAATISARTGRTVDRIYVHAKIGIVDDHWLTVGSANVNAHSFYNDSEVNVVACDPALARATRLRLWAEHLERSETEVSAEPARVVDELWRPIATEQRERARRGAPRTHRLIALEATSRRATRLRGSIDNLVVDG